MAFMSPLLNFLIQETFCGLSADSDWTHLQKYSQRVKNFKFDSSKDKPILLALQFQYSSKL